MKKLFIMAMAVAAISLASCGNKNSANAEGSDSTAVDSAKTEAVASTANAPTEECVFEGGEVYQNGEYGYCLSIPAGPTKGKDSKTGCNYEYNANFHGGLYTIVTKLPSAFSDRTIPDCQMGLENGAEGMDYKILKNEINGRTFKFVTVDKFGNYEGKYFQYTDEYEYEVEFTYKEDEAKFNEYFDKIIGSLKIK